MYILSEQKSTNSGEYTKQYTKHNERGYAAAESYKCSSLSL